jgi:predicted transcriptional regulator
MTIQQQIKNLKKSGVKLIDIAAATGYTPAYVSKVHKGNIDAGPRFKSAFRRNVLKITPLEKENEQLRTLVEQLTNQLNAIKEIINQQK